LKSFAAVGMSKAEDNSSSSSSNQSTGATKRESSVRGGSFFAHVFRGSSGSSNNNPNAPAMDKGFSVSMKSLTKNASSPRNRRVKSFSHTDELDGTLRRGSDKAYSPGNQRYVQTAADLKDDSGFPYLQDALARPRSANEAESYYRRMLNSTPPRTVPVSSNEDEAADSLAMKKAFTEFHNSSTYGRDAVSAYLGDEPSSSGQARVWALQQHQPSLRYRHHAAASCDNLLATVPQHRRLSEDVHILHNKRVLKAVLGVETWQSGRRYLIAPAALVACPINVRNHLSGGGVEDLADAAMRKSAVFDNIVLGPCLVSEQSVAQTSSVQHWSTATLVLRQNYLLEYEQDSDLKGTPRGYAHLEHCTSQAHPVFTDALELTFYGSPCAKTDKRVIMIRVMQQADRGHWVTCLNRAAALTVEDMYSYDPESTLGKGTYSSVYPAMRNDHDGPVENEDRVYNRAIKLFNKTQFWRHVVNGRERADTIVRETAVQTALTFRCTSVQSFLRIYGFFETSEHVVLELELLDGRDLFHHISTGKSPLKEAEAARITRDILETLDAMNRLGISHRDIKPANILMCTNPDNKPGLPVVKVGDFGMATFVGVDGQVRGRCGTPGYVAPEIFSAGSYGGYGNKVDVFSAGVTLYVMLCGYEPFYGETDAELVAANKAAQVEYPDEEWSTVSPLARDLVKKMMHHDPIERIDAQQAMKHPWIVRYNTSTPNEVIEKQLPNNADEDVACVVS